ncbi:HIT family hydrolase [Thermococcus litoralis DSM 5473]|uniref:HIT family hydrolase n=1 Tax=Thermococcus litoralis (strain ATCC 51850 / DSM 5473 / JCM 8560 / NS-C) TaxID=523849 RepID=H3ZKI5_THELN|nr:HIT family protein [Thermococcus litoralis]EHR79587.1 HIT family hydrolase [Thermococcus litoralis DSM 5473]
MDCPFCNPSEEVLLYENENIRILIDSFPANRGHLLIVPKRHIEDWRKLKEEEKQAIMKGVELAIEKLSEALKPDGFNVGINLGEAAGQTVAHIHVHVIPRYKGDTNFPRGGIRKAVLDIEDENLSLKEKWVKNRLTFEEKEILKRLFTHI